jgi:hypothetical protein
MPTLSTLPTYPIADREARVSFMLTESGSNYARVWVTKAPAGSKLAGEILESSRSRFVVYQGDGGENQPWRFTPDKGGRYSFVAQEYTKGSAFGGGYEGDPLGAPTETKVGGETTLTLNVGEKLTQPIGVSPDNATLVFWVWADTIRKTTLQQHDEASPRIDADSPTPRTKAAIESTDVQGALAALADVAATTAMGNIATIASEMVTDLNAHNALGSTVHNAADTANVIPKELGSAPTPRTLPDFVNEALFKMRRHRLNDHGGDAGSGTPPGVGSAAYHQLAGNGKADLVNMPLYASVGNLAEAYAALADIWRAHEGHRVNTAVHGSADAANTLAVLPPLLQVHLHYLMALASLSPTAPDTWQSGVTALVSGAGFELSP